MFEKLWPQIHHLFSIFCRKFGKDRLCGQPESLEIQVKLLKTCLLPTSCLLYLQLVGETAPICIHLALAWFLEDRLSKYFLNSQ